ncbi:hypothetical protein LOTGIDRAFT_167401 [Lottia gigantea]|uniref:Claudin n=1 Tax=Lottia gigantea TaxID=225164 RepID=V4BB09_LOTGI|nr:hypothetical protein LOTGIDRAFT_167401 [Lottia gigantea]ESO86169.1 hypothetical protein LOTGIDRAFT_167401 [Lottia gigantea]
MSSKSEKMVFGMVAMFILFMSIGLEITGSFLPFWMNPVNQTFSNTGGNVSFSLWTKQECWDIICETKIIHVQWTQEECYNKDGKDECQIFHGTKSKPVTKCYQAFYCNITWNFQELHKTPSLLLMGVAFEIPSVLCGVIALVICIIKFFLLVEFPNRSRRHIKTAYLTLSGMAGTGSVVSIIIFCVQLNKHEFHLGWGPVFPGVGGFLQLCISICGYLTWNNPNEDDWSDGVHSSFLDQSTDSTIKPTTKPEEEMFKIEI